MPDDEVEQIITEVDEDGSGTVDYEGILNIFFIISFIFLLIEFYKLMTG
jgi:Ca2+-binding EF-hand superfamily protein